MSGDPKKPCLRRSLDIIPVEHEGQNLFAVRDPLGLADEPILVPGEILFLMSLMDGESSLTDIQIEFTKKYGELIMSDRIESIAAELDGKGYMQSPALDERVRRVEEEYRSAPARAASHAGQAYPESGDELRSLLAGIIPPRTGDAPDAAPPRGLVAPHIDIERGKKVYGLAYSALAGKRPPRTAVLFGTGHFAEGNTYILTDKDFDTPLGRARADGEFCGKLASSCVFDIYKGQLSHRNEHSIEFQVLFLQHLFGGETTPDGAGMPLIVPILCTSFDPVMGSVETPSSLPEVSGFLDALGEAVSACPGDVLLVAGADMCHVGPRFGGGEALDQAALDRVRSEDERALEAGAARGAEAFYQEIAALQNQNSVCGVVSIYTVLKFLEDGKGKLLGYDMAVEPDGSSAVGFAALTID
jgi:AmmeMemoRadiSam system protein B